MINECCKLDSKVLRRSPISNVYDGKQSGLDWSMFRPLSPGQSNPESGTGGERL
jgi:hypothetical protein